MKKKGAKNKIGEKKAPDSELFSTSVAATHPRVRRLDRAGDDLERERKRERKREREVEFERKRDKKKSESEEEVERERANCPPLRVNAGREKKTETAFVSLTSQSLVHLEAKHPELVRRRVELRVHRRLLLLLMEVLLVRVGEGRGRGLIFFSRSTKEMRRDTSEQRLVPNSSRWFPCFLSFVFELKELVTFVTQEAKKAGKARGKGCSEDSFFFRLWRRCKLQNSRHWRSTFSFFSFLLRKNTHPSPAAIAPAAASISVPRGGGVRRVVSSLHRSFRTRRGAEKEGRGRETEVKNEMHLCRPSSRG